MCHFEEIYAINLQSILKKHIKLHFSLPLKTTGWPIENCSLRQNNESKKKKKWKSQYFISSLSKINRKEMKLTQFYTFLNHAKFFFCTLVSLVCIQIFFQQLYLHLKIIALKYIYYFQIKNSHTPNTSHFKIAYIFCFERAEMKWKKFFSTIFCYLKISTFSVECKITHTRFFFSLLFHTNCISLVTVFFYIISNRNEREKLKKETK